jgi:hypothetical protein
MRLARLAGSPITYNRSYKYKFPYTYLGRRRLSNCKTGWLARGEKPWTDAWLFAGAGTFVLAFIMYSGLRSRVLTYGGARR